ncbi:MAG: DUF3014 domain-containing protein [Rubrivivax sp.]|nr:DUF3014 domain-containing protein [Rubrivivax sp.]
MKHPALVLAVALVLALLGLAGWHWRDAWWPASGGTTPTTGGPVPAAPAVPASVAAAPALPPPAPAPIRHPIEAASAVESPAPPTPPPTLESALAQLFGTEALATMLVSEDFARRVVATVDNLGREKAPARLWPLSTPAGRFTTRNQGDREEIGAENFVRYARHIGFIEGVDPKRVAALYRRFYPQFQQAYEDLGYPGRHFNDRVVEVIDLLLAVPEPGEPVAVRPPVIQGPIQPLRPWLLYEFADPAQQAAPAGVQLMLRMGPENRRRLKARLAEFRRLVARA